MSVVLSPGEEMDPAMPSPDIVETIFAEVLVQLALPAAAAEKLKSKETIERKWKTIKMNQAMLSDESMQVIRTWNASDEDFLTHMDRAENPDLETMRQLKSRLSTANRGYLQGFLQYRGVHILMKAMHKRLVHRPRSDFDHAVLMEACEAFKAVMNTADGLEEVVATDSSIEVLAMCLDFSCPPLARTVLEILAVTSYFSRADLVRTALEYLHRRHMLAPYELLTQALGEADIAVKASIMIFINNFITSTQSLDDRIMIRRYLLSQDITKTCEQIVKEFDPEREVEIYHELPDTTTLTQTLNTTTFNASHTSTAFSNSLNLGQGGSDPRLMSVFASPPSPNPYTDRGMSVRSPPLGAETSQKAEDGKTPIAPEKGIMAGRGLTAKNKKNQTKQLVSSLLNVSKTKTRWYILDGKTLCWTRLEGGGDADRDDNDSISMSKVLDIKEHTTDPDLLKVAQFHFDIVTESRVLSIAVETEELYFKWLTALRCAKEKSRTQGAGVGRVRDIEILDVKVVRDKLSMFEKQVAVFHAVMAADLEGTVKDVLGGLNAADGPAVFTFLQAELDSAGLGDQLLKLMHQLMLLPADYLLGRDTWEVLQMIVGDLRNFDRTRKNNLEDWLASIEDLQTLVLARRELDAKIKRARASAGTEAIGAQEKVIKALEEEVADLKARLAAANTTARRTSLLGVSNSIHLMGSSMMGSSVTSIHESFRESVSLPAPPATPASSVPPSKPPHPLAATLATKQQQQQQQLHQEPSESADGPSPPRPVHPLAAALAGHQKKAQGGAEESASSSSETTTTSPARPQHPLAAMLAAKQANGPPKEESGVSMSARPVHPLAQALAGAKAVGAGNGGDGGGALSSTRPVHPLAQVLAGAKAAGSDGGSPPSSRPVHPVAQALAGAKGGAAPTLIAESSSSATTAPPPPPPPPKTPEALGLPTKRKVDPPQKLKGLFWSVLPPTKVVGTQWAHLNDFKGIDMQMLIEDFGVKEQEAAKPQAAAKAEGPKKISLFDPKRNQNVMIALGRFKMTPEQIKAAVATLAEAFLTGENTQKLMNILPTADEVNTVHGFNGDTHQLGAVEQFFLVISAVPRVELRLKCWAATLAFDDNLALFKQKIQVILTGAQAVKSSKAFPKVLEVVLAVGNIMNGTSARGGCYGFRLDVLAKLNDVKAAGGRTKGSLLNFIAEQADTKIPACHALVQELSGVHEAAEHSLGHLENDVKAMQINLNLIKKEIEEADALTDEFAKPFKTKMSRFLSRIDKSWAEANTSMQVLTTLLGATVGSFGEDLGKLSDSDPCQKFFHSISIFVNAYRDALEMNKKVAAEAAKKAANINTPRGPAADSATDAASKGGKQTHNLFSSFKQAQSNKTADEIVAEFRDKMNKRRPFA